MYYFLMECTFPPLIFLHCHPFSCLRRTWWVGVKRMYGEKESRGNRLAQVKYNNILLTTILS